MAASTDYTSTLTRDQYLIYAARLAGILGENEVLSAPLLANGSILLASLNDAWHNEGINLNTNRVTTYPMPTASAVLGTDGSTTYSCVEGHVADSTSRPTTGAYWSDKWRAHGSGGAAWASGATYVAANEFSLPVGLMYVKEAFIRSAAGYDDPITIISETEYLGITDKFTSGKPARLWIKDRQWNAKVAVMWPAFPDDSTRVLHINGVYLMGDFTGASTELDAPGTARLAMLFELASLLAEMYQRPQAASQLSVRAQALKRNFFRAYQRSDGTIRQVMSRFPRRFRLRR